MTSSPILAIGLMSGTSLDGVDAAIIETDGESVSHFGPWLTLSYPKTLRERIRAAALDPACGDIMRLEQEITLFHVQAVRQLLEKAHLQPREVGIIGFHGQTIMHRPADGITWQLADAHLLAERTHIDVVNDFRRRDMAAGGVGAPLVPLYHAALARELPKPTAILNIGGIANITFIGPAENHILAFDCGPGNVLLNDWAERKRGLPHDEDGKLALAGVVHQGWLQEWVQDAFFAVQPPKALDRNHFKGLLELSLSTEDGAATFTAFTAASVARAVEHLPEPPAVWYVCGGGRHNPALMKALADYLKTPVHNVDTLGWQGDALEAQAFAYLAVRSLRGLPLTLPLTTGAGRAVTGGSLCKK